MANRVHHLSCVTMCPRLPVNERGEMVIHVLAVETDRDGLIVVDTGFGTLAVEEPARIPRLFHALARPRLERQATALARIEALGFSASDVRHVVVTHLDLDHAGGLRDFPDARVHLHARELEAARYPRSFNERHRYLPYQIEGVELIPYDDAGDDWLGLGAVRSLQGIEADVALVPLFGHSRGHSGVAVRDGDGWLLHAGDAYFHHSELADPPRGTGPLNVFQSLAQVDARQRLANRRRLGELARARPDEVEIFSAHDPIELERYL